MIIPDANLLLYAYNSDSPFHEEAAAWWENCLSSDEVVGLCEVVLFSFIRVGTNTKAFTAPLSIDEAVQHVRTWMQVPVTEYISGDLDDFEQSLDLLVQAGTGGNLTSDAHIAALSLKYRAVVHTADTDFVRFTKVKWHNPILES